MSTTPWMDRALDDTLSSGLRCVVEVEAVHPVLGTMPLEILTGQLTIDEARVPRTQLQGALALTDDALAVLDETREVRVVVRAGYEYPGRIRDVHELCNLLLTQATVKRPEQRIEFDASSDEIKVAAAPWTLPDLRAGIGVRDAVQNIIGATAGLNASIRVLVDPDLENVAAFTEAPSVDYDTNYQALLVDVADRVGARFYHQSGYYFVTRLEWDPSPVASITHGPTGLLSSYESQRDRVGWGNAQVVVYKWRDANGNSRTVVGRAEQTTGPLAVAAVGRKVLPVITRDVPTTQAAANAVAASILARQITRGRVDAVEAARALWWLRPGRGVTIATPDDPAAVRIVAAVTFDLPRATMNVRTRTPVEE